MTKLSEYSYILPPELIAQEPLARRDASRLLVLDRAAGTVAEQGFAQIVNYLERGDVLVCNDTKVIPARVFAHRKSGGRVEVFLYEQTGPAEYRVLLRPKNRIRDGEELVLSNGEMVRVLFDGNDRRAVFLHDGDIGALLDEVGSVPLPPYITRAPSAADAERYQTVYAACAGASAAPTAGLHFTPELMDALREKGVIVSTLTLHTSYGTFAPVKEEEIERHRMHREWFSLPASTADAVNRAKAAGKRVVAVGTTSVRVLETRAAGGRVEPGEGWTDIFMYPPYRFQIVDRLITNFHLPESTLLMLVSAFASKDLIMRAYAYAVEHRFRFFSYGDAMVIV